jgi:hypothetical protein
MVRKDTLSGFRLLGVLVTLAGAGCGGSSASNQAVVADSGVVRIDASSPGTDAASAPAEAGAEGQSNAVAAMPEASTEASAMPDAMPEAATEAGPACMLGNGFNSGGAGSCLVTAQATCGTDTFEVNCQCPQGTCTCTSSLGHAFGMDGGAVTFMGCPACPTPEQALRLCGAPE